MPSSRIQFAYELELPMPRLVRTDSASSTDSSLPLTPEDDCIEYPFEGDNVKPYSLPEDPYFNTLRAQRPQRRSFAPAEARAGTPAVLLCIFIVLATILDVLRVISWIPLCSRVIVRELAVVFQHEVQIRRERGEDYAATKLACYYILAPLAAVCCLLVPLL